MTPWAVAHQAPLSIGFPRQEYWSGLPFPFPGNLLNPGIESRSPALQVDSLLTEPPGKPSIYASQSTLDFFSHNTYVVCKYILICKIPCSCLFLLKKKKSHILIDYLGPRDGCHTSTESLTATACTKYQTGTLAVQ